MRHWSRQILDAISLAKICSGSPEEDVSIASPELRRSYYFRPVPPVRDRNEVR